MLKIINNLYAEVLKLHKCNTVTPGVLFKPFATAWKLYQDVPEQERHWLLYFKLLKVAQLTAKASKSLFIYQYALTFVFTYIENKPELKPLCSTKWWQEKDDRLALTGLEFTTWDYRKLFTSVLNYVLQYQEPRFREQWLVFNHGVVGVLEHCDMQLNTNGKFIQTVEGTTVDVLKTPNDPHLRKIAALQYPDFGYFYTGEPTTIKS